MKTTYFKIVFLCMFTLIVHAQTGSINNTLSSEGSFNIKDGTTTFLTLSQNNGVLVLNKSLSVPPTTDAMTGIIFKGGTKFIHDYQASGTLGYNTFVGLNAGNFTMTTTGSSVSDASYNTSVGAYSLTNLTSGQANSALGSYALNDNSTGFCNSAVGYYALGSNTSGADNSAFGDLALNLNTTGNYNSAFGSGALKANTSGNSNSAFGCGTQEQSTNGINNSSFGVASLRSNFSGNDNCSFGYASLYLTTGDCNTAIGRYAGYNLTTGSNNTIVGDNAEPSTSSVSNEITLGNSSITTLRCKVNSISSLSDRRDKRNIKDLSLGLDFLMTVRPRIFNWDRRDWYKDENPDGSKMELTPTAGFIAQELDTAQIRANAEWLNLVLKSNPERLEATPGNLLPVIVKSIQELKAENDSLKSEISQLRASITEQVRKELRTALQRAIQPESEAVKLSLNDERK